MAADKKPFHPCNCEFWRAPHARLARRISALATAVLGAHDSRRCRFRATRRLYSLQSGETELGVTRRRLATFVVPSLRVAGCVAGGLGGRGPSVTRHLRGTRPLTPGCVRRPVATASLIPDFASLHSGYRPHDHTAAKSPFAHTSLVIVQKSASVPAAMATRMPAIRSW